MNDRPPRGIALLLTLTATVLSAVVLGSVDGGETNPPRTIERHRSVLLVCRAVSNGTPIAAPTFIGMTPRDAMQLACDQVLHVAWKPELQSLDGVVRTQVPAAGTAMLTGGFVQLSMQ